MNLEELMLKRRSVRDFTNEPVTDLEIDKLLHYAMSGPSACNKKPWEFFIIRDNKLDLIRNKLNRVGYNAPTLILVCGNKENFLPKEIEDFWIQDCSAAVENILLGVTDMGLGAVWCGILPNKERMKIVKESLCLDDKYIPFAIVAIGHTTEKLEPRDQYEKEKIHII